MVAKMKFLLHSKHSLGNSYRTVIIRMGSTLCPACRPSWGPLGRNTEVLELIVILLSPMAMMVIFSVEFRGRKG